jgi:ubiquinone/menaquinone biosynthesis C-methylase UbiE
MSERFKQTWWDKNLGQKFGEFKNWIGDSNAESKVFVRKYVADQGHKSLVDFGCGPATEFFGYKNDGYDINYTGVDSSWVLYSHITSQGVPSLYSPVEEVPLPSSSADVAFSRHVLEHLPTFRECLGEMIRIGKKEVINVFFIEPTEEAEKIDFYEPDQLYHNRYNKGDVEAFVNSNPKVESFRWVRITTKEVGLFITLKG